jgi:hypothetical protein
MLLAAIALAGTADAGPITSCEQLVPSGETGVLMQDLVCPRPSSWPFTPTGVVLDGGATLDLNGFTITGDGSGVGVLCAPQRLASSRRPCTVTGPGTLRGFYAGINAAGRLTMTVTDVVVADNTVGILSPLLQRLVATRVTARDNGEEGIWAQGLITDDVTATGNGRDGVVAFKMARLQRLTATGNGRNGLVLGGGRSRTTITDSTLAGNGGPDDFDLTAERRVRLVRSTCGRGARIRTTRRGGVETTTIVGTLCP